MSLAQKKARKHKGFRAKCRVKAEPPCGENDAFSDRGWDIRPSNNANPVCRHQGRQSPPPRQRSVILWPWKVAGMRSHIHARGAVGGCLAQLGHRVFGERGHMGAMDFVAR